MNEGHFYLCEIGGQDTALVVQPTGLQLLQQFQQIVRNGLNIQKEWRTQTAVIMETGKINNKSSK